MGTAADVNVQMQLTGDASVILQQMLSRKRVLAQSGSWTMQAIHPSEDLQGLAGSGNTSMPGSLQQLMQQQVPASGESPQQPIEDAAAAHNSNSSSSSSSSRPAAKAMMQQLQQEARAAAEAASGRGSCASNWEYAAAEEELERELKQLGVLGGQQQQHSAGGSMSLEAHRQPSASGVAAPADPYAEPDGSTMVAHSLHQLAGNAHAAGPAGTNDGCSDVADMLSAALDEALLGDPSTSVDDIVGILSIALNMQPGQLKASSNTSSGVSGAPPAAGQQRQQRVQAPPTRQQDLAAAAPPAAGMPSPEAFLAAAEQLLGLPPGMMQGSSDPDTAAAAAAAACSGVGSAVLGSSRERRGVGGDGSNIAPRETASEMAAWLLEQARSTHASAAAHACVSQATEPTGKAPAGGAAAQQAARDSVRAWQAEGGLMYKHSSGSSSFKAAMAGLGYSAGSGSSSAGGAAAGAGVAAGAGAAAAAGYLGNLQQQSRVSPLSARSFGSGSYAGRANSRRSMSPHAGTTNTTTAMQQPNGAGEREMCMIPAEVEKAWQQGVRSPDREGSAAQGAAVGAGAGGGLASYAAILEGFDGSSGPQEWSGYDGLMGLRQHQQQQQRKTGSGAGAGSSGGGAGKQQQQQVDPQDVNSYRAKPTPELDVKLQRLYRRNVDWRQRCEVVYARQRHAEVASELQECTFRPEINKKSEQLAQHNSMRYPQRPIRPVTPSSATAAAKQQQQKQKQRPASTGRVGMRSWSDKQQQQQREQQQEQHGAALRAAAAAAAVLGEEAGMQLMDHMLRSSRKLAAATAHISMPAAKAPHKQHQRNDVADSIDDEGFTFSSPSKATRLSSSSKAVSSGGGNSSSSLQRQGSPPKVPAAARRLYEDAFVKRERQVQVQQVTQASERKARAWSAPRSGAYRDVAPRVYNYLQDGSANSGATHHHHLQTGMDECTFHPQTNCGHSKFPSRCRTISPHCTQAAAAAAAAAGSGGSPLASVDGDFKQAMLQQLQGHQQQLQEESPDFFALLQQREQARSAAGAAAAEIAAAAGDAGDGEGEHQQGDWAEFIERQGLFLLIKEAKRVQMAAELARRKQPELSPGSKRILKEKQRMAEQMRSCSLDSAAAAASTALQHLHQHYHVTAHVHPGRLHYQPNTSSAADAAVGYAEEVSSAAEAEAESPGGVSVGSPASAGSAFLSRVQHQVKQQQQHSYNSPQSCSSPGASSCTSGSPGNSGSFGYCGNTPTSGLRGSCGSAARGAHGSGAAAATKGPVFSFRPAITRKAAAMKPRSCDDMSEGDRLRKEAKLEQLRIMMGARELAGATFAPDMSPTRRRPGSAGAGWGSVPPKIRLSPDGLQAYLGSLEQKRRDVEEKRRRTQQQREEAELAECTFKPATTPAPAYLAATAGLGYTARFIETRMAGALAGSGSAPAGSSSQHEHSKLN